MTAEAVLGFATLDALLPRQAQIADKAHFDLAPYARVDSAGIAFLLELQRACRRRGTALVLTGASEQCRRLAAFLGVDTLLGLTPETVP
jgi:ABC-type transporter Mla MlaB component